MLLDVAYHYPRGRILNFWIFVEQTNDSEPAVVQNGDTSISSLQSGNKGLPVQSPAFAQCDTSRSPCPDRPPPPPPTQKLVWSWLRRHILGRVGWWGPLWTVLTDFDGGNSISAGLKLSQRPCECSRHPEVIRPSQAPT